jgi:hypothetical protein
MKTIGYLVVSILILMSLSCAGMNSSEQRTLSGGAIGAGAGALVGGPVGAAVGGAAGAGVGYYRPEIEQGVGEARDKTFE